MRKKIAFFTSAGGNIGDAIHSKGLIYILNQVFCKEEFAIHPIIQWRNLYNYDIHRSDYDYIIIGGSPCLSPKWYESYKYGVEMHDFMWRNRKAVKILCGGGSNFPLDYSVDDVYEDESFEKELLDFYGEFDLIILRDRFAHKIFTRSNLKAYCLPCPSIFILKVYNYIKRGRSRKKPLIVFGSPECINSKLISEDRKDQIVDTQRELSQRIPKYNAAMVSGRDFPMIQSFPKIGTKVIKFDSILELLTTIRNASCVFSARLHSAIPASMFGIPVYLIPFDTRKYCTEFFNIKVIESFEDVKPYKFKKIDVEAYEKAYINLLRRVK